ncbi:MAG TPA: hypothetical protein VFJ76_05430 [Solirubrobacterales bacterium]|nr:hypothetical protein [Solirubrobacterales bacterium]
MRAGEEQEALAGLADRLCAQLGYRINSDDPWRTRPELDEPRGRLFPELNRAEDEALVATARRCLVRLAGALGTDRREVISENVYEALLDGAEVVMRRELAAGRRVSALMPSFVFLIALPLVTEDQALELSRRTASLLELPCE